MNKKQPQPQPQQQRQSALDQVMAFIHGVANSQIHPIQAFQQASSLLGGIAAAPFPQAAAGKGPVSHQAAKLTPMQQQQQEAQMVRNAAIKQTAYTPQAAAYLQSLPLYPYGMEPVSSVRNDRTGGQYARGGFEDGPAPEQPTVALNMRYVQPNPGPVGVLRHEFLHALDANTNPNIMASYAPTGPNTADSTDFWGLLRHGDKFAAHAISNRMYPKNNTGIYGKPDPRTRDIESYAYYGEQGPQVLLNPKMASAYQNVYLPESKAVNQSFKYPAIEQQNIWEE